MEVFMPNSSLSKTFSFRTETSHLTYYLLQHCKTLSTLLTADGIPLWHSQLADSIQLLASDVEGLCSSFASIQVKLVTSNRFLK
jgi:hypothetical protein